MVMGIYDVNLTSNNAKLSELNIYGGASRIGMIDKEVILCTGGTAQAAPVYPAPDPVIHILGYKKYEITNYLGNVNAVVSDRKIYTGGTYVAVMLMNSDYYPFGMEMPGRNSTPNNYRFGYNGMEKDDEVKNHSGSSYTTEFRQYDPRLGRWLSLDTLMQMFPSVSPYCAFDNNPIMYTDPLGLAPGNGDETVKREGRTRKGDREFREDYVRNKKDVEDGTKVVFEYPDDKKSSKFTFTYDSKKGKSGGWDIDQEWVSYSGQEKPYHNHDFISGSEGNKESSDLAKLKRELQGNPSDGIIVEDIKGTQSEAGDENNNDSDGNNNDSDGNNNDSDGNGNNNDRDRRNDKKKEPLVFDPTPIIVPAEFVGGRSVLKRDAVGPTTNSLREIARQLKKNPSLRFTIVANAAMGAGETWESITSTKVTARVLVTNRTITISNILISMGVNSNQIIRRLGSPTSGQNMTGTLSLPE